MDRVERWAIGKLVPYAKNPRLHSQDQVEQIARSMQQFGQAQLVVVDEQGEIIAGHGRVLAAEHLGWSSVMVGVAIGWSAEQKRAYRIADNQLALNAAWDQSLLKMEIQELHLADFDLPVLGFPELEVVEFLSGLGDGTQAASVDPDKTLSERFGVVPFSVLNAREGWWQDRKRAWIALGIQSELGRGENLLKFSETVLEPDPVKRGAKAQRRQREKAARAKASNG